MRAITKFKLPFREWMRSNDAMTDQTHFIFDDARFSNNVICTVFDTLKQRAIALELKDDKIRALYGHSYYASGFFTKVHKITSKPPDILYHGTSPSAAKNIMSEGLRPMNRQYVHLSINENTAFQVGERKTILKKKEEPVIITISAIEAFDTGVCFYQASDSVWLTDYVHPKFMELLK